MREQKNRQKIIIIANKSEVLIEKKIVDRRMRIEKFANSRKLHHQKHENRIFKKICLF